MNDGLALTPPMGWNSWNAFGCDIDGSLIEETAQIMVKTGMRDAGYRFVNLDDGWMAPSRDRGGELVGDPHRFPEGIRALADHVHDRGLLFGIYEDAGSQTCGGYPGSRGHFAEDSRTFSSWGVDYLKLDWCYTEHSDHPRQAYALMRDALRRAGRPIVLSICCWGVDEPWEWGADTGHLWRTTGDIEPSWDSIMNILDQQVRLGPYAGPGHWNDPDMLEVGNGDMTVMEEQAHFSLWSMLAAPLICGNDLRSMSDATKSMLLNREVIAIDQDPAGVAAEKIWRGQDEEVWSRPLANGDRAVLLLNRGCTSKQIGVNARALGLPPADAYLMRDLWTEEASTTIDRIEAVVGPRACAMLRVRAGDPTDAAAARGLSIDRRFFRHGSSNRVALVYRSLDGKLPGQLHLSVRGPSDWEMGPLSEARPGEDGAVMQDWGIRVPRETVSGDYELVLGASTDGQGLSSALIETREAVVVTHPFGSPSGYLSDGSWLQAVNGSWTAGYPLVGSDRSAMGRPISIGGMAYEKGLGVHAFSQLWYYLGGAGRRFVADVGMDDIGGDDPIPFGRQSLASGTASFEVWVDGRQIHDSGIVKRGEAARPVDVSVAGAEVLKLAVTDGGDGTYQDHADWARARVLVER